jgi:hypothetical protein
MKSPASYHGGQRSNRFTRGNRFAHGPAPRPPGPLRRAPMDREPAAWETNATGPFLTIGEVAVYALGHDRFRLVWPDGKREVEGFDEARSHAHELAR